MAQMPLQRFTWHSQRVLSIAILSALIATCHSDTNNAVDHQAIPVAGSVQQASEIQSQFLCSSVPVDVNVVVNLWNHKEQLLFVQDAGQAIFVKLPQEKYKSGLELTAGTRIHITGSFKADSYWIDASDLEIVGAGPPVEPIEVRLPALMPGKMWSHRIRTKGTVTSVVYRDDRSELSLRDGVTEFHLRIPGDIGRHYAESLIESEIELVATLDYRMDSCGRPTIFFCQMNENERVRVISTGKPAMQAIKKISRISNLRTLTKIESKQPLRLSGQVTFLTEDRLLLEDESGALLVEREFAVESLKLNEMLEMIGVASMDGQTAKFRPQFVGRGIFTPAPPARDLIADQVDVSMLPRRLSIAGDIKSYRSVGETREINLRDGQTTFSAVFVADDAQFARMTLRQVRRVRVEGLVEEPGENSNASFVIRLSSPAHISILEQWNSVDKQRLVAIGLGAIILLSIATGCAIALRVQVARKTRRLQQLESSLVQSQKMDAIGRLAGGVAHDFNNLLMAISGNLELVKLAPDQPVDELLNTIDAAEKATDRASRLVRNLLGFSRQSNLSLAVANPNLVIADLHELLERTLGSKTEIRLSLASDVWPVKLDETQFQQVLLNMCLNARDALRNERGYISIATQNVTNRHGEFVQISISDNGVGMTAETRDKIFEPFFTTKPRGQGTGLGLAMSYGIIRQHNGRIHCRSELDAGSRFDIQLPRCSNTPQRSKQASPETSVIRRH